MKCWEKADLEIQAALDLMVEKYKVLPVRLVLPQRGEFEEELENKLEDRLLEIGIPAHLHAHLARMLGAKYAELLVQRPEVQEKLETMEPSQRGAFIGWSFLLHFLRSIGIEESPEALRDLADEVVFERLFGDEDEEEES